MIFQFGFGTVYFKLKKEKKFNLSLFNLKIKLLFF